MKVAPCPGERGAGRGAIAHPGSMSEYIRHKQILPSEEIDAIQALAPAALIAWQESIKRASPRAEFSDWLKVFTWVASNACVCRSFAAVDVELSSVCSFAVTFCSAVWAVANCLWYVAICALRSLWALERRLAR